MSDTQEKNRKEAISQLQSLKSDFEVAARHAENDTPRWQRSYPKRYDVENFNKFAKVVQRTINGLVAEKEWNEVVWPLLDVRLDTHSWGSHIEEVQLKKRFSFTKREDRKLATQYLDFSQKVEKIMPLVRNACTP